MSEREARGILKDLDRKAELVGLDGWEMSYGLVAKGVEGKEELRGEGWCGTWRIFPDNQKLK